MRHALTCLVAAHLLAATVPWTLAVVKLRVWRQWHHFWIGVVLCILAAPSLPHAWAIAVCALGLWIAFDDSYQHFRQWTTGDLTYESPWHRAYALALGTTATCHYVTVGAGVGIMFSPVAHGTLAGGSLMSPLYATTPAQLDLLLWRWQWVVTFDRAP